MTQARRYVLIETGVSMAINAVLSATFTGLIFGGRGLVAPAGAGGYAIDFIVQSFIVILMSVAAPSLITRARLKSGKLALPSPPGSPPQLWPRALLAAAGGAVGLGGAAAALSLLAGAQPLGVLLPVKTAYGAALALIFTPWALRALITARLKATP